MIITRLRRLATGSIVIIGLTAAAYAATETTPAPAPTDRFDLKTIPGGTYTLDEQHANVMFIVTHLSLSNYPGRFDTVSGSLKFNSKDPTKSKLEITIDTASVDTMVQKLTEHLKTKDFFDVATYPTATFKSTKIEKLTDKTGRVTGDLTLHGVTKPVTLDVTFNGGAPHIRTGIPQLGFSARGTFKRSDFGMSNFVPNVSDEVSLILETEFGLKK